MIYFTSWYGRLGNNIFQLIHVIHIALFYKYRICFSCDSHPFFDIRIIEKYFSNNNDDGKKIEDKYNFFYGSEIKNISNEVYGKNKKETIDLLKSAFIIKDVNKLDENDIVIHVRSGDLFNKNPYSEYIPPPLSYYTNILNNNKYNMIIIVCEDEINPVVHELLKLYHNANYSKNNLENDIKIILGATNIIESVGSFIPGLTIFSSNIKKIYSPYMYKRQLEQYYLINKPWKNTQEQRDAIINYKYN
jgi:hypothetical protein